jgi:hypothetical protein
VTEQNEKMQATTKEKYSYVNTQESESCAQTRERENQNDKNTRCSEDDIKKENSNERLLQYNVIRGEGRLLFTLMVSVEKVEPLIILIA